MIQSHSSLRITSYTSTIQARFDTSTVSAMAALPSSRSPKEMVLTEVKVSKCWWKIISNHRWGSGESTDGNEHVMGSEHERMLWSWAISLSCFLQWEIHTQRSALPGRYMHNAKFCIELCRATFQQDVGKLCICDQGMAYATWSTMEGSAGWIENSLGWSIRIHTGIFKTNKTQTFFLTKLIPWCPLTPWPVKTIGCCSICLHNDSVLWIMPFRRTHC